MRAMKRFLSLSILFTFNYALVSPYLQGTTALNIADNNDTLVSTKQWNSIEITGLKVEKSETEVVFEGRKVPELIENTKATLRLFGHGFTNDMTISLTTSSCSPTSSHGFSVVENGVSEHSAVVEIIVPDASDQDYHICAKTANSEAMSQAKKDWLVIKSKRVSIPLWLMIAIIVVCLVFSALFSGLNLGLMALDKTQLKILINTGTEAEKKYAKIIQPVRNHGNYLLCSILLGNVLVNATNATLMGGLTSGLIAVIFTTFLIVIFGEVIPQAICSRYGLLVGAKTIWVTKFLMVLTFPLAYPTSKILDCVLGEEIGSVYSRERFKELVRVTTDGNDLDKDEVNIISGALDMKKKTVAEVMTKVEDVFMLSYEDAILDYDTISEIMKSGYSRIPVYEGNRHNVQKLLLIKDLALIDPADNTPLRTVCEFYQNHLFYVFEDVTLAMVFKQFKSGQHGHMAFVRRINNDGGPYCETIGLITMEDVIEELIQAEIMDETDINQQLPLRQKVRAEKSEAFAAFVDRREVQRIHITPQLASACFQYLTTCVDAFKPERISSTILHRLLKQDVIFQIKCKGKDKNDPSLVIFEQGKPADYFVLILEGRVEVTVGIEGLTFECGPFTFFGSDAFVQNVGVQRKENARGSLQSLNLNAQLEYKFEPDYSVKAIKDVLYIVIKRSIYMAAVRATLMKCSQKIFDDHHDDEDVKVFLDSLREDYKTLQATTTDVANNAK